MTNLIDANENTFNLIFKDPFKRNNCGVLIPSVHINYPYLDGGNIIENYVDDSCDRHISHLRDIILRGNYEIFCTVIEDFEKKDLFMWRSSYTIMSGAFFKSDEIFNKLIELGGDINASNDENQSILYHYIQYEHIYRIKECEPFKNNEKKKFLDNVKKLILLGANPLQKDLIKNKTIFELVNDGTEVGNEIIEIFNQSEIITKSIKVPRIDNQNNISYESDIRNMYMMLSKKLYEKDRCIYHYQDEIKYGYFEDDNEKDSCKDDYKTKFEELDRQIIEYKNELLKLHNM